MKLYDILKSFFSEKGWEEVSNHDKAKNFFMINRIMSSAFPLQANALNNTKIDPVSVVNYWKEVLSKQYKSPPSWFYPGGGKKEKEKLYEPKEEVKLFITSKYEISNREIKELSKYNPKEFKKFCQAIEEMLA